MIIFSVRHQRLLLEMKKNFFLSIILTGFAIFLTHTLWYNTGYFNIDKFFIILIITFVLFYKATDYTNIPNLFKEKSKIEICFILTFFILLFLPISNINSDYRSEQEKRLLAESPTLIINKTKINYNFGKDFEKWFNDRFWDRYAVIRINRAIKYYIGLRYVKIQKTFFIDKKTGILHTRLYYPTFRKNDLDKIFMSIRYLNEFCTKNNIKLYTIIVPDKEAIYSPIRQNKNPELTEYINKNSDLKIIIPIQELYENSKKEYMYYKTDHHWTNAGAFIGYKKIINEIKKDYPDIKPLRYEDFDISKSPKVNTTYGETCENFLLPINICEKSLDVEYKYFEHKNSEELKIQKGNIYHIYSYDKGADYRIITIGTSMLYTLDEFIPYNFKNVKEIRLNNLINHPDEKFRIIKFYKETILNYKPDIIILCVGYNNLLKLPQILEDKF